MGRLLALAGALLLVAGCGGDDDPPPVAATPAPTETEAATATPAVATGPVAQGDGSADGGHFTFVITELKRSGRTVVLNATVTLAGDSPSDSIQLGTTFARTRADAFDGVALIDPEGERKYLVAREPSGRCVCSVRLADVLVERDAPVNLQATLTAPPATVSTVDVTVPNVKTFTDVAIAD
jgi:hypothetical protein